MTTPDSLPRAGLPLVLALGLAFALPYARAASILRDIYGTAPGNTGFHLATANDFEGGAQSVATSTSTFHSAPHALRLKFLPGVARNVVGLRFVTAGFTPNPMDLTADKNTTALEFWINPKARPFVPSLTVSLVSHSGVKVETRRLLSAYLRPLAYADEWSFVSIPLRDFSDTGFTYDNQTRQSTPAPFDWARVVGLNFSCDTSESPFYDPSVDDIRLYSTIDSLAVNGRPLEENHAASLRPRGITLAALHPASTGTVTSKRPGAIAGRGGERGLGAQHPARRL